MKREHVRPPTGVTGADWKNNGNKVWWIQALFYHLWVDDREVEAQGLNCGNFEYHIYMPIKPQMIEGNATMWGGWSGKGNARDRKISWTPNSKGNLPPKHAHKITRVSHSQVRMTQAWNLKFRGTPHFQRIYPKSRYMSRKITEWIVYSICKNTLPSTIFRPNVSAELIV